MDRRIYDVPKLTVAEFARLVGMSEASVRQACRDGLIEHFRIGLRIRIPETEVERSYVPRAEAGASR